MLVLVILLCIAALPALGWSVYLLVLVLFSGRMKAVDPGAPTKRFDIVVPAHNEEGQIAATVESLLATDYPAELRRVWVVADNCTDATAERATAAGATALVRTNAEKRGKGYALEFAYDKLMVDSFADAIVVVDADTSVSKNLLRAFGTRFEQGAQAVQAEYGVRNPKASWRTRLITIALAIFHELRSLARERMGVSCGLRGNGMGFSRAIIASVPHDAYSIVEDIEYGIRLGRAGHRVWYVAEANVLGDMVATEERVEVAARTLGRGALATRQDPPRQSVRRRVRKEERDALRSRHGSRRTRADGCRPLDGARCGSGDGHRDGDAHDRGRHPVGVLARGAPPLCGARGRAVRLWISRRARFDGGSPLHRLEAGAVAPTFVTKEG